MFFIEDIRQQFNCICLKLAKWFSMNTRLLELIKLILFTIVQLKWLNNGYKRDEILFNIANYLRNH